MSRRWVVNASPLILLGKVDHLHLLSEMADRVLIPAGVVAEVAPGPRREGPLRTFLASPAVEIVDSPRIPDRIVAWDLGRGESEVLALALDCGARRVVLDDLEARRCAQSCQLSVIGTLGVILGSKQRGSLPEARPVLERLVSVGLYVSEALLADALEHVGERWR